MHDIDRDRIKPPAAGAQHHYARDVCGKPVGAARSIRCCRMSPTISASASRPPPASPPSSPSPLPIIQPVLGAAADLFGKARLMIVCLVLLGLANILGAMATSFPLLFASRILAGIGSGGVFPVALGLTSDLVGPEKRQIAIGRTLAGSMTGNLLGATVSGLIGDFLGWRGVLAILGGLGRGCGSIAVAAGFRGAALTTSAARRALSALKSGYRTIFTNPNARICYLGGVRRRLLRARAVSLHRLVPVRARRNLAVDRRHRDRRICGRRSVLHLTVSRFLPRSASRA